MTSDNDAVEEPIPEGVAVERSLHEQRCDELEHQLSVLKTSQTLILNVASNWKLPVDPRSQQLRREILDAHPKYGDADLDAYWPGVEALLRRRGAADEGVATSEPVTDDGFLFQLLDSDDVLAHIIFHGLLGVLDDKPQHQEAVLLDALLVSMAASYELFMGEVIRIATRMQPEVVCSGEKVLQVRDLIRAESKEAIVDEISARWIDGKIRAGFDGWAGTLRDKFGLHPMGGDHSKKLKEVMERRNAIVHAGARAGLQYMACGAPMVKLDELLTVDPGYLANAADRLMLDALYTAHNVMKRSAGRDEDDLAIAASVICDSAYRLLRVDRLEVVSQYFENDTLKGARASTRNVMAVNAWLARKQAGEDVSSEVASWEARLPDSTEEARRPFELAKLALLDRHEEALDLSLRMLQDGSLHLIDWLEWPLLRGTRSYAMEADRFPDVEAWFRPRRDTDN